MGTDGQNRQALCRRGRHEMGAPASTDDVDENGDVIWVRACAWCGIEEGFTIPGAEVRP